MPDFRKTLSTYYSKAGGSADLWEAVEALAHLGPPPVVLGLALARGVSALLDDAVADISDDKPKRSSKKKADAE